MKAKVTPLRPEGRSAKIVTTNNRRSGHSNTTTSLTSPHTTTMKNNNNDTPTEQNKLHNTTNPTIRSATLQTNAPTDNNTHPFTWQVTRLCPVPLFHPLETGAIRLTKVSLEHLTAHISEFMRLHSVQCYYHADRVDCVSSKLVKFVVQLWQAGEENDSTIILEIQRRQGCSIAMQQIRQSLVHYVQTGEALAPTASIRCRRFPPSMCHRLRSKNHHDVIRDDASARAAKTLCMYLLESPRLDQKYLGLESLKAATDTRVTFPRVAEQVSMALLVGNNDCDARLRHPFLQYFRNAEQSGPTAASTSDHDEDMYSDGYDYETTGYAKSRCFGAAAHVLALSALSNALESLVWQKQRAAGLGSGNNPNDSTRWSLDVHSEFWMTICGALEYNLVAAISRPHEAALSAKCIRLLSQLGTTTVFPVDRFLPLLFHACEHGRTYHSHLEQECRDLIQCLVASAATVSTSPSISGLA